MNNNYGLSPLNNFDSDNSNSWIHNFLGLLPAAVAAPFQNYFNNKYSIEIYKQKLIIASEERALILQTIKELLLEEKITDQQFNDLMRAYYLTYMVCH